jgi:hypothetical protein
MIFVKSSCGIIKLKTLKYYVVSHLTDLSNLTQNFLISQRITQGPNTPLGVMLHPLKHEPPLSIRYQNGSYPY